MMATSYPRAGDAQTIEWTMGCKNLVASHYEPNKS